MEVDFTSVISYLNGLLGGILAMTGGILAMTGGILAHACVTDPYRGLEEVWS